MSINTKTMITLIIGILLGIGSVMLFKPSTEPMKMSPDKEKKPLYWVAPMDADFRKDAPGKSPMGMDLVPVYENTSSAENAGVGAVTIAPHVIQNLGVRTALVEYQKMDTTISTVGYVQYDEDRLIHIHPRVDGWIEKLFVKASGAPVKQGEPLYTLYSPQLVNAQEEFVIALKRNNTTLVSAAKARLHALQLSSDFINRLEKSRKVEQSITFNAPQSGVVDGLKIREGFYVKPGNTLMSIAQLEHVWVEAEVFERDAAIVQKGLAVSMTLDYLPGDKWIGVVDYVYPALDAKTRTLRVRLKFNNPNFKLKPNMFAQVNIHTRNGEKTIQVPKGSVIRTGKQDRVVLALGDGQFKSVAVIIGQVNDENIEILMGLNRGDTVVTSAQFLIDSESSKSSDFRRMEQSDVSSATVDGFINAIDTANRRLTIRRGAIEKWDRPPATMDFILASHIDIQSLKIETNISFTFEVRDDLVIVAVSPKLIDPQAMNGGGH